MRLRVGPFAVALLLSLAVASAAIAAPNQVFLDRGLLEYDEKNFEAARENFEKAVELDPEDPRARHYLGLALLSLGRLDEAATQLAQARAKLPDDVDIAFALGVALFYQGKYEQARPHFEVVAAKEPKRSDLGYYLGRIYFEGREYERALSTLEGAETTDPAVAQLTRFYAGLTKQRLGRTEEAVKEMEVAAALRPTSPIGIAARRFEELVAAAPPEERRLRAEVRVGYQYDDNVRIAPTRNVLELGAPERRGTGEVFLVRGDLDFLRLGGFQATAGYSFVAIINDVVRGFDVQDHRPGVEAAYRGTLLKIPFTTGMRYVFDLLFLDDELQSMRHIVQPYAIAGWSSWTDTLLSYRFTANDVKTNPVLGLPEERGESTRHEAVVQQTFYFPLLGVRHAFRLGYAYDVEQAEGDDYDYIGHKALAGLRLQLPYEVLFTADFEYHTREYPHRHALALFLNATNAAGSPFRTRRSDWENTLLVTLSREIFTHRSLGSLALSLDYFRDRNESTLSIFDYARNVVSLNLIWRY